MDVTLLLVADCPNQDLVLLHLTQALDLVGLAGTPVRQVLVTTDVQARALEFHGSPTVLLDGVDPFLPTGGEHIGLSCRVYRQPSGYAGAPSVAQLVTALQSHRS